MKIVPGEVFAIKISAGYGFLQFIETGELNIETVRVLEPIKPTNEISQIEVDIKERYVIDFVLKAALKRKLIERTGIFQIPLKFSVPLKARTKHTIRGEFLGWHIVNKKTLKRELKQELTANELLLSPHGMPNDTLLKEWLETDFRLENWK